MIDISHKLYEYRLIDLTSNELIQKLPSRFPDDLLSASNEKLALQHYAATYADDINYISQHCGFDTRQKMLLEILTEIVNFRSAKPDLDDHVRDIIARYKVEADKVDSPVNPLSPDIEEPEPPTTSITGTFNLPINVGDILYYIDLHDGYSISSVQIAGVAVFEDGVYAVTYHNTETDYSGVGDNPPADVELCDWLFITREAAEKWVKENVKPPYYVYEADRWLDPNLYLPETTERDPESEVYVKFRKNGIVRKVSSVYKSGIDNPEVQGFWNLNKSVKYTDIIAWMSDGVDDPEDIDEVTDRIFM